LRLFLGGAAVYRCDNRPVLSTGFIAAEVTLRRGKQFFRSLSGQHQASILADRPIPLLFDTLPLRSCIHKK